MEYLLGDLYNKDIGMAGFYIIKGPNFLKLPWGVFLVRASLLGAIVQH